MRTGDNKRSRRVKGYEAGGHSVRGRLVLDGRDGRDRVGETEVVRSGVGTQIWDSPCPISPAKKGVIVRFVLDKRRQSKTNVTEGVDLRWALSG